MKRLFLALVILFLALCAVFGLALYNLNSLIAQFKPTIEESISNAIGSPVTFSSIEASGFPNLKLALKDASFNGAAEISVPNLSLSVALLPLLSKKIEVDTISINGATIGSKGGEIVLVDNLSLKAGVKFEDGDTAVKAITASARIAEKDEVSLEGSDVAFLKDGTLNLGASTITTKNETFPLSGTYNVKSKSGDIKVSTSTFSGTLNVGLALNPDSFSSDISGSGLNAAEILSFLNPGSKEIITGTVNSFTSKIKGPMAGEIAKGISGPFKLNLENGELKGINLGAKVLGATKGIPLLDGALLANVNPKYQGYFASENTPIKSLSAEGVLGGGSVSLGSLVLVSDAYTLNSSGKAVMGGAVDLKARIVFNKEVSEGIVGSIKELRKILSADGTLEIPLELAGVPPSLTVIPDVGRLIELAAKGALREKAGEAIGKVLEKQGIGKDAQKAIEGLFDF